ncbi:hypothetical protein [Kineothrix alysoides]|nr:hypothetical protein [Kineothrix alysoides]
MRFKKYVILVMGVLICLSGCSGNEDRLSDGKNNVDKVLDAQVNVADGEPAAQQSKQTKETTDAAKDVTTDATDVAKDVTTDVTKSSERQGNNSENDAAGLTQESVKDQENIDYDLTAMGSDMIYATVYQLMINPEEYVGKTIRMEGTYYATYYEPTAKYYHYVIIQDATACCAQGLEFIWEDGSHVYPEEYPEDEADVTVTGTFETYNEEGDENLYCRLKDASLEIGK